MEGKEATLGERRRKWSPRAPVSAGYHSWAPITNTTTTTIIIMLITTTCSQTSSLVGAQCPNTTMTSFERIGSVAIKDSLLTVLYTAPNASSTLGGRPSYGGLELANQQNTPITAECNNRCRRSSKCRAFLVDYARHTCYSVEQPANYLQSSSSSSGLMRAPPPIHLVPTQERTSYFEKICLNMPTGGCDRAWVYERVMGYHLHGHDDKIIDDVPSRLKCQEHCYNEREFKCHSGEYDYLTMQCRLSIVDRHLKPNAFRPTVQNVDYFENQCVPVGSQCDAFDQYDDMDLGRAEIMRVANTSDQCQQFCTQTLKAFICRSFTWNPITGKCYLNSANTFMAGGLDRLISAPGMIYYQRNDCIDLKLECDTTAMTLNLRTNEPFRGRMYVRDDPNACETMGRSSLTSSLSIPFQAQGARCAVREPPNRYSSVVVVQQHPMIQRKSDRYIKVVCDFQTTNKTITSSYNVVNNPWTSTALINATSFAPKIRLRITDKFGVDITGAKLGDELYLRIEAETESVYDMVARSVLAKSGTTDESIMLIDKDGCPTDFRIFPSLKKLNRRTIVGKFDAFKFSSDVVVRFQVDVQFCLNQCPSTSCDSNLLLNSQQLTNDAFLDSNTGNSNPQQQQTTISPPISSSTNLPPQTQQQQQSNLNDNINNRDSSFVTAFSSTQAPVPSYNHNHLHHQQQQQQQQNRPSLPPSPMPVNAAPMAHNLHQQHNDHLRGGSNQNQLLNYTSAAGTSSSNNDGYYYHQNHGSSSPHGSLGGRHPLPSMPIGLAATGLMAASNPPNFTYSTNQPSIMDLLAPTNDPQIFEQSQPRSASFQQQQQLGSHSDQVPAPRMGGGSPGMEALKNGAQSNAAAVATSAGGLRPKPDQQQQLISGNSIVDAQANANEANPGSSLVDETSGRAAATTAASSASASGHEQQVSANRLRRRRSAEPMPLTPRHVPLQREIIVESSPGSSSSSSSSSQQASASAGSSKQPASIELETSRQHRQKPQHQQQSHRGGKSSGRENPNKKNEPSLSLAPPPPPMNSADGLNRNGPAYDLNAGSSNKQQQEPGPTTDGANSRQQSDHNGATLLCTSRHSLVIASMAFCTVQFLTIALCALTWFHRRDTKFKVKHHHHQQQHHHHQTGGRLY